MSIIKPKIKEKVIQDFYEMVITDLKEREATAQRLTESGDIPLGSVTNEQAFGKLLMSALNGYILRYLSEENS